MTPEFDQNIDENDGSICKQIACPDYQFYNVAKKKMPKEKPENISRGFKSHIQ